jgi:hypothetical protein
MQNLLLLALTITILCTALPASEGFGFQSGKNAAASRRGGAKTNSPLLEDALASYPFVNDDKTKLSTNFNELARLYGDEEALDMVKIMPRVLRFKSENFERCLNSWEEQFGLENAQKMVQRNPGLLGIPPVLTGDDKPAYFMSYVIAATRPTPLKVAVYAVLAVLLAGNADFWQGGGFYNGGMVEGNL